ncbi:MAG: hypothetical protein JWO54_761 [Candidatus Saccharibacteria bacterium]|nr:hypothetical protein [Candidatus Saccharibacteria bacterium]
MKLWAHKHFTVRSLFASLSIVAILACLNLTSFVHAQTDTKTLITVYDRNTESSFLTDKKTIGEALKDNGIELDIRDSVEPSRDDELIAPDYQVNIYRARPVFVIDGSTRVKIMTPYQVPERIAKDAGITMYPEDATRLLPSGDFIGDGAGLQMSIDRAVPLTLDLYSKKTLIRTQGDTVGEMLKEKGIVLGVNGRVSVPETTPIVSGMEVRVWQEGKQTVTLDEATPFTSERIFDADREVGYKVVSTVGVPGVRANTYEIEVKDGVEISRTKIASIVTKEPVKQIEVVGIKNRPGALTHSKGAQMWTDSKGVVHRETYYDLNMSRVMQSCGQGGFYEVRVDGVKVDRDGYVIIAANYSRYPKCSITETSVGPAKVYDTGGFAANHPDGFDLATDWSRADGI